MILSEEKMQEVMASVPHDANLYEYARAIEAAVRAEAKQEPVAWRFVQQGYTHYTDERRDWYDAVGIEEVTPLYAAPQSCCFGDDDPDRLADKIYRAMIAAAPELLALAERVARLNRDAGEIGAGMLASLVDEARAVVAAAKGE